MAKSLIALIVNLISLIKALIQLYISSENHKDGRKEVYDEIEQYKQQALKKAEAVEKADDPKSKSDILGGM